MTTSDIAAPKLKHDQLRIKILNDLIIQAKLSNTKLDKELFLASLHVGTIAIARTQAAVSGTVGKIAIGFSSLEKGMVHGLFWLVAPKSKSAPTKLQVISMDGTMIGEVKVEYEASRPRGIAKEIRIESISTISPGKYLIDGSIKMEDGWHKFNLVYF